MKKLLFSCLMGIAPMLLLPDSLTAQNFSWAKNLGGTEWDDVCDIAVDVQGNVYSIGFFEATADLDPGPGIVPFVSTGTAIGQRDIFISKLSPAGDFIWAKHIPARSMNTESHRPSLALDAGGNIYCTAGFRFSGDFDPGAGTSLLTSTGVGDMFVLKLTANGDFIWVRQIGGVSWQVPSSIALDTSGNVYTAGYHMGSTDFDPGAGVTTLTSASNVDAQLFVHKMSADGTFLWVKTVGASGSDHATGLAVKGDHVYVTGRFDGTEDFDPDPAVTLNLTATNPFQAFVAKFDASGNLTWAKSTSAGAPNSYSRGNVISVDDAGNIVYAGDFSGTIDADPGAGNFPIATPNATSQIFVSSLKSNGDFSWAGIMAGNGGPNFPEGITHDFYGNICITGSYHGTVDFDPGPGLAELTPTMPGYTQTFILQLTSAGAFTWVKHFNDGNSYGRSIATDATGSIYIGGTLNDVPVDFDPDSTVFTLTSNAWADGYICKLVSATLGNPVHGEGFVSAYPNPAGHTLFIRAPSGNHGTLELYDMWGHHLATYPQNTGSIDVTSLPGGSYFLRTGNPGEIIKFQVAK